MRMLSMILLCVTGVLTAVDDGPSVRRLASPQIDWAASATSPGYAAASAHEPRFSDKSLWPHLLGKEAYTAEKWPKARLLVWAKPGVDGDAKARGAVLSVVDPANWLEDGKPATELWDGDTDLMLPPAGKRYTVSMRDCGKRQEFRHITVGSNGQLHGGGDGVGRQISGHVWVKRGGGIGSQGATGFLGSRHTFFRNDNDVSLRQPGFDPVGCSQYFSFARGVGSVEFLGHATTGDEFMVESGTVVVGPDSIVQAGRSCNPIVQKGATLALMDNAWFGTWANTWDAPDLTIAGGTLQAGLPERPIRRSAAVGLSFKNHTTATYTAGSDGPPGVTIACPRVPSLLLGAGATVRSFSAELKKARLMLREAGYFTLFIGGGSTRLFPYDGEYGFWLNRSPKITHQYAWFDALPKGVDVLAFTGVSLSGVGFDGFHAGGIITTSAGTSATWTELSFTPANAATVKALFSVVPMAKSSGHY